MITANKFFNRLRGPGLSPTGSWEAWKRTKILPALAMHHVPDQGVDDKSPPLKAYVNHGRWVAKCECGGCELVWEEGLFFCMSCLNGAHGHKVRRVVFPRSRKRIEGLLAQRPVINRNWKPNETLAALEDENKAHAAELLGGAQ